jgi:hypothetical protein
MAFDTDVWLRTGKDMESGMIAPGVPLSDSTVRLVRL